MVRKREKKGRDSPEEGRKKTGRDWNLQTHPKRGGFSHLSRKIGEKKAEKNWVRRPYLSAIQK